MANAILVLSPIEPVITQPLLLASDGQTPATGLANVMLSIPRWNGTSWDFLDFASMGFSATPARPQVAMTEISAAYFPGAYAYILDVSKVTNRCPSSVYLFSIVAPATVLNRRQTGIRVDGLADNYNAGAAAGLGGFSKVVHPDGTVTYYLP